MNFIKNTWSAFFKKQQEPKAEQTQKQSEQNEQIPESVLEELFDLSASFMKQSKVQTSNEDKLMAYGLFKQVTIGDCNTEKPQMFDFVGKSKWEAWSRLKGMSKREAMCNYIVKANEIDKEIGKKINDKLCPEEKDAVGTSFKKVEQVDYSDEYSHPYFKPIVKDEDIPEITHALLLQKNNSPEVYPLHFAIDKERVDLVPRFLQVVSVEEINGMVDSEGMGILEYAELIENEEILEMVRAKLT